MHTTTKHATRREALKRLKPFIGDWSMSAGPLIVPDGRDGPRTVFEWMLDDQFIVQQSEIAKIPDPNTPNCAAIISYDPDAEAYTQHYFDSRGVVRVYAMTFADGVWTLLRNAPDFTPLDFSQRFTGTFSEDRNTIAGTWEKSVDGVRWEKDFELTYTRRV